MFVWNRNKPTKKNQNKLWNPIQNQPKVEG
jgi:hypothetical protein